MQNHDSPGSGDELKSGRWCSLHPRVVTRWRIDTVGNGLFVAVPLAVAELIARNSGWLDGWPILVAPAVVLALAIVAGLVWPPIVYRRWSYRLADDALEIRRGVIVQRRSAVPYRRVQQVDLSKGPIDRLLGLVSADLTTASATSDGSVPGLTPTDAEAFRQLVLERAGRDDAV